MNGGSIYCLALGMAFAAGMFGHTDMSVWEVTFPSSWRSNINLVVGGYRALARDMLLLTFVPLLVLPRRRSHFLIFYTLSLVATVLNPLTGRPLMRIVKPASYWRLVYLLPLPLCAGLVVRCFVPGAMRFKTPVRLIGGLLTLTIAVLAYRGSAIAGVQLKPPWAYKLPRSEMSLARVSHVISNMGRSYWPPRRPLL